MTSKYNDDADSFFDPEPAPLKGDYDRGDTPPRNKHRDSPTGSSDSLTHSKTDNSATKSDRKMSHRNRDRHDDSYSRRHSGYSDSRSYSKSYESYSDDDFESESEYDKRSPRKFASSSKTKTMRRTYSGSSSTYSTSSAYGRSNAQYRPRNKGSPKKGGKGRSQSQGSKMSPREPDVVAKRMLSARLHSINRLRNELGELQREYEEVVRENKLLHSLQRKQERAIDRYEGQQNDLGDLLSRHNNEVEHLQKRVQKYKHENLDKERRLRDQNDELMKTQNALKRMKAIVKERNLLERDELSRKLQDTQEERDEKERRVEELEKYVENLKKNHRVEVIELKSRAREMEHKLSHLDHEHEKMKITLKEKEKELDIRNIYSHRIVRAPTKLSNVSTTPLPSSRKVKTANKAVQVVDLSEKPTSVRDSLEFVEEEESPRETSKDDSFDRELEREKERERERQRQEEDRRRLEEDDAARRQRAEDMRVLMDLDVGIGNKETEDEKRKREEAERLEKEKKKQQRDREEKERRAREEQERKEREEREKREQEEAEKRERERKEQEERERATQEETEKLDEERRKKDLLLAKMKEIDSGKNPTPDSPKSHKQYNFTDAISNMHNGLPSHPSEERHSGKKRTKDKEDEIEFGSYAPSFGRRGPEKSKPKADWLVFNPDDDNDNKNVIGSGEGGDQNNKKKPDLGDNIFTAATKAKPVSDKDAYPWEKEVSVTSQPRAGRRATTNNFFSDEDDGNDDKLLPRRPRDTNTVFTSSKPTVNAIDDFDDDIEEVIL
ncbi:uncharacterized protein LOC144432536 [Glandiceps talaboti]